jgi:hypothetical protein
VEMKRFAFCKVSKNESHETFSADECKKSKIFLVRSIRNVQNTCCCPNSQHFCRTETKNEAVVFMCLCLVVYCLLVVSLDCKISTEYKYPTSYFTVRTWYSDTVCYYIRRYILAYCKTRDFRIFPDHFIRLFEKHACQKHYFSKK